MLSRLISSFPATAAVPVALGVTIFATTVGAQDPAKAVLDSASKIAAEKLIRVVGPQEVTIDPVAKTATVRLLNPTADTAVVEVSLAFARPRAPKADAMLAEGLLSEDEASADSLRDEAQRMDSLGRIWSLESWVKEPLPTQLWLGPHQTVQLTLHVQVPDSLTPGEYSAHLVVATMLVQELPPLQISLAGGVGTLKGKAIFPQHASTAPPAAVKLVYRVTAQTP